MVPLLVKTFVLKKLMMEKKFVLYLKAGFSVGVKYSCGEEIEENKYQEVIGGQGLIQFAIKSFAFTVVHFKQKNLISLH